MSFVAFLSAVLSTTHQVYQWGNGPSVRFGQLDYSKIGKLTGTKITGKILPKDLAGEWYCAINGYEFTIKINASPLNVRNSSAHRIFVKCECGQWMPIGRIVQHGSAKKHEGSKLFRQTLGDVQ